MEKRYSEQEILMLVSGLHLLVERERSLTNLVDDTGRKQIQYFINKYKKLIRKLESEV